MGQYYYPIILNESHRPMAWAYSHDYKEPWTREDGTTFKMGTGLKLTEHSWLGNGFVCSFERLLTPTGKYHMAPVVWAGDYADGEPELTTKVMGKNGIEYDHEVNLYGLCFGKDDDEVKSGAEIDTKIKLRKSPVDKELYPFLVNYDKNEFVDKRKVPAVHPYWDRGGNGWALHPLPLLTCEGCGRGGGDFNGVDPNNLIGRWARNRIGVERTVPEGFTELIFDLVESA